MARWEEEDKGLKGQILCKASSKIDFRYSTGTTMDSERVCSSACAGVCVCEESHITVQLKSTCPCGHYLSDITELAGCRHLA